MIGGWLDVPNLPLHDWERGAHLERYRYAYRAIVAGRGVQKTLVADAACGMGYGTALLAQYTEASGYDLDPRAIREAQSRYLTCRFFQADIQPKTFEGYDVLVSFETLEHLDDPWSFVAQLAPPTLICSAPIIPTVRFNRFHQHEWDEAGFRQLVEQRYVIDDLWRQAGPRGCDVYAVIRGHRR